MAMGYLNFSELARFTAWVKPMTRPVLVTIQGLSKQYPAVKRGSRILAVSDPFPYDDYMVFFAAAMLYRDPSLTVVRAKFHPEALAQRDTFDYVVELPAK